MIFSVPEITGNEPDVLAEIDEIRKKLSYALKTSTRWTGVLRRNLTARAVQGSNSIEGYNVTFEDAVAAIEGEEPTTAAPEPWAAVVGYRNALTYVMQRSDDDHFELNEELVRALHNLMLQHDPTKNPGRWRRGPIFVRREPSGEIVYEGPDAEHVPAFMHEFVESLGSLDKSTHPIVRAAMAHLNLVMIHPFSDGNGRMGRALQTVVLARDGILAPPFCSIEEWLGSKANTEAYYEVLGQVGAGAWHPERDARPWVRFCMSAHLQQAFTVSRRVKEIAKLWGELEVESRRRGLDERMIYALYDAAIGIRVRSARYRLVADLSNQVATRDLRDLVQEGLLVPNGETRGRYYVASQGLREIWRRTRETRPEFQDPFRTAAAPVTKSSPVAPPSTAVVAPVSAFPSLPPQHVDQPPQP
ncbi:MAG: Fic family protein [bacterium]